MKQVVVFLFLMLSMPVCAQDEERMQFGVRMDLADLGFNAYSTLNATVGWRINRRNYLGLGTGCHIIDVYHDADPSLGNGSTPSIPIYADYIHYYPLKNDKNSFYLGAEAGMTIYPGKLPLKGDKDRTDPYSCLKVGWDFTMKNRFGIFFGPSLKIYRGTCLSLDFGLRF